jgi:hypothetical protein
MRLLAHLLMKLFVLIVQFSISYLFEMTIVPEIYGLLLRHWAVRSLICQTAHSAQIFPLSISFTGTL